jgi:hypothetical protein
MYAYLSYDTAQKGMTHVDKFQSVFNDQRGNKSATKVLIIASVDDDDEKILSYLTPTNGETVVFNLNDTHAIDTDPNNNKRSLFQLVKNSFIKIKFDLFV